MERPKTPEEAMALTRTRQEEADSLAKRVDRLVTSMRKIQRENGFAPRMEIVFRGQK